MDKRNKDMILTVTRTNIILAFLVALMLIFVKFSFAIAFLVGTTTAIINFIINSYVINRCFKGKNAKVFIPISFLVRMSLILGVAILFRANYIDLIMYLIGFIFHQVAIFRYALKKPKQV
ncbi:ATP synthase subunit I [uncultured Clostridium sp.]|uniref:ATP synthase subunit I n=1 Tax=uncultured Clostridium sp. TaxID=59620 RepID=UPI002618C684|nr:ATP synthase subunit I [uncultured Clostridium sp.]